MLGTNLGADLSTVGVLAQWLRDTSMKVDRAAEQMRRMRETSTEHWTDDAGEYFAEQLRIGEKNAHDMVDALQRLARLVGDCYDGLARAQQLMAEAESVALQGGLNVQDHRITLPTWGELARDYPGMPIYDRRQLETLQDLRRETYAQAQNLVERACQILVDLLERLNDNSDWSSLYFTLGDITRGELALLMNLKRQGLDLAANESTQRALQASKDIEWHSRRALRTEKWLPVDMAINRKIDAQDLSSAYTTKAGRAGMIAKILNKGGPTLLISSVAWSIYADENPAAKAIISGAAGAGTTGMVGLGLAKAAAIGLFISGPTGVVVGIAVSSLVGYLVSEATGNAYDEVEPAREKLLRAYRDLGTGSVETNSQQEE